MGKKYILAPIIEGWGSPFYKSDFKFGPVVEMEIAKFSTRQDIEIISQDFLSFGLDSKRNVFAWILAAAEQIVRDMAYSDVLSVAVFGKSLGGKEALEIYEDHIDFFFGPIFRQAALCLIDPHGASFGDGIVGPHDGNHPLDLSAELRGEAGRRRFFSACVHQKIKHPTGAKLLGADIDILVADEKVNHFNIIHMPPALDAIRQTLEFIAS